MKKEKRIFSENLRELIDSVSPLEMRPFSDTIGKLKNEIRKAFRAVTCRNEPKVFYGLLAEEYGGKMYSSEMYQYLAKKEERGDWQKIDARLIAAVYDVLWGASGDAFRFLAPAYMMCSLEWCIGDNNIEINWLGAFGPFVTPKTIMKYETDSFYEEKYKYFSERQKEVTCLWMSYWREKLQIVEGLDTSLGDGFRMCPWEIQSYLGSKERTLRQFMQEQNKNVLSKLL